MFGGLELNGGLEQLVAMGKGIGSYAATLLKTARPSCLMRTALSAQAQIRGEKAPIRAEPVTRSWP